MIHPAKKAQITSLLTEKVIILAEYLDFANVFSKISAKVLQEQTGVNEDAIKLENNKQSPYRPIYSLGFVELKTLKTYIKINLTNGFIRLSKSPAGALILFVQKPNSSLCLCVNY